MTTPSPVGRPAGRPDLVITWDAADALDTVQAARTGGPVAVFGASGPAGTAIVRTAASEGSYAGETVTYRHRRSQPDDAAGVFGDAPYLLAVRLYVPEPYRDDVRKWLEEEHIERQLAVSGTYWYEGFEAASGRFAFLNLWGLADPGVIDTPAWAEARDTEWRGRLLAAFEEMDRAVYRRLDPPMPGIGPGSGA